jgi:hypothetical protein
MESSSRAWFTPMSQLSGRKTKDKQAETYRYKYEKYKSKYKKISN